MPHICFDETNFHIPPLEDADEEGLLIIGGKPSPERVLAAYAKGVFPWYNEEALPLWWSPDPRFVLFPHELHISRSMKKLLKRPPFTFTINTAFEQVIRACATIARDDQDGTWITPQMEQVYQQLYLDGFGYSAEAWLNNQLAGGMYGVKIGKIFFGESMFSKVANASKFAFIKFVQQLTMEGVGLVDAQVHTAHVESLGARLIDRTEFYQRLQQLIGS